MQHSLAWLHPSPSEVQVDPSGPASLLLLVPHWPPLHDRPLQQSPALLHAAEVCPQGGAQVPREVSQYWLQQSPFAPHGSSWAQQPLAIPHPVGVSLSPGADSLSPGVLSLSPGGIESVVLAAASGVLPPESLGGFAPASAFAGVLLPDPLGFPPLGFFPAAPASLPALLLLLGMLEGGLGAVAVVVAVGVLVALSFAPASALLDEPLLPQVPLLQVSEQQSPKSEQVEPLALHATGPQVPAPPSVTLQSWLQQSADVPHDPPLALHAGGPHTPPLHWALQQSLALVQARPSFLHCVGSQVPEMQLWLQQSEAWLHVFPSLEQVGWSHAPFVHELLQQSLAFAHALPDAVQVGSAHLPPLHALLQHSL